MAKRQSKQYGVYYVPMSQSVGKGDNNRSQGTGAFKIAWRAPIDSYPKDVAKELGVIAEDAKKPTPGLVFGANSPRPARVRINVKKSQGKSSSYILFANPGNIPRLINGNVLKGKSFKGGTITTVSLPKTSTNPTRKKKSSNSKNTRNTNNNRRRKRR